MIFNELIKEKLENFNFILNTNDFMSLGILIIIIIFLYYISTLSKNKGKLLVILIIILILIKIDNNLNKNEKFANISSDIQTIYPELNTGDIVLFRSYINNDLAYIVAMKLFLSSVENNYFTHIGMIYKADNGKLYILENGGESFFCSYQNKVIDKAVMMVDFLDRINNTNNYRIHIVKTNIHKHIDIDRLKKSIEKYKNYTLKDINCIDYIVRLLYDSDIIKLPRGAAMPYYLFDSILDKSNYNFDIEFNPIIIKDY